MAAEFDNLPALFEQLTPEARIDAICKLSKYVLPTLASVSSGVIMRQEKPETDMFIIPGL
ncbi:hypothetical protein RS130_11610 [Paraglaciecola aquimarina]|uniref:Crp/Fnr family transcriptional regulator n=1 Tax=Paraglaciecola aquimarina TaxID=1235557 RepID=A0ABU3SWV2_9ALTE|nr:hypothetical protein [Paraglaciecola aquimarina]MDU0354496.1 hypothetical protein [Paraglaciecola aquimarina]